MCVACDYVLFDSTEDSGENAPRYAFVIKFQFTATSWNPHAVFMDERIGRPPVDLSEGVGHKYITYHTEVDFDALLGFMFEGWDA
jgi:hypothetical protein